MTALTLVTAPKPFRDTGISARQYNAISSWTQLGGVEVFLLGDDEGLAEAASALGVRHLPGVRRNENGTPLVSSMVDLARRYAQSDLLCLINADMILMGDAVEAALFVR